MKKILFPVMVLLYSTMCAQIGVNNKDPKATMDITAKTTDGSKSEGLIAPRLTGNQIKAADSQYDTPQIGTIIYATSAASPTSLKTVNITEEGYYYFDSSKVWKKFSIGTGSTGDSTDDAWINDSANSMVKLGTQSNGSSSRTPGTEFVVKDNGSLGIGTTSPNAYAMMDISSSNKGILVPRVALTSNTADLNADGDNDVTNQPKGLLVYNIGTGLLKYVGYVFWDGSEWRALNGTSTAEGTVTALDCLSASLDPSSYTANVQYNGALSIPYSGGNGGYYAGQTITSTGVTGLTAKLDPGSFANGNGILKYYVSGTPSASTPTLANFAINIGGKNCTASVGAGSKGVLSEYAQVNFESYGTGSGGVAGNGTLATVLPGAVNIARVKRITEAIFRIDFNVPFVDNNYIVAGTVWEGALNNANNVQPQMYAPNYITITTNALSTAIANDTDVRPISPTNPSYNLEARQIVMKDASSYVVKYRTHFYVVEGYNAAPIVGVLY